MKKTRKPQFCTFYNVRGCNFSFKCTAESFPTVQFRGKVIKNYLFATSFPKSPSRIHDFFCYKINPIIKITEVEVQQWFCQINKFYILILVNAFCLWVYGVVFFYFKNYSDIGSALLQQCTYVWEYFIALVGLL